MSYRNKTYVAFASEDINNYRMMQAWSKNENIDFDFIDAHGLFGARDTSKPETIKGQLRERMKNAKQVVLLGSVSARTKGSDGRSFLAYEVKIAIELDLPIVIANLGGSRDVVRGFIPQPMLDVDYYSLSVSFQPKIIRFALDGYAAGFAASTKSGTHLYSEAIYKSLGI